MDRYGLPEPPIKLDGFPLCAHPDGDRREVAAPGELCAQDGGQPATLEILRRSIHRQIRGAILEMKCCRRCEGLDLRDVRCAACAWMRGAAMGVAGIAELLGWAGEVQPLMSLIGIYDPGWQKRCFQGVHRG